VSVWGSGFVLCVGQFVVGLGELVFAVFGIVCCWFGGVRLCCVWDSLVWVWGVIVCCVWDNLVLVSGSEFVLFVGKFVVGLGE